MKLASCLWLSVSGGCILVCLGRRLPRAPPNSAAPRTTDTLPADRSLPTARCVMARQFMAKFLGLVLCALLLLFTTCDLHSASWPNCLQAVHIYRSVVTDVVCTCFTLSWTHNMSQRRPQLFLVWCNLYGDGFTVFMLIFLLRHFNSCAGEHHFWLIGPVNNLYCLTHHLTDFQPLNRCLLFLSQYTQLEAYCCHQCEVGGANSQSLDSLKTGQIAWCRSIRLQQFSLLHQQSLIDNWPITCSGLCVRVWNKSMILKYLQW